MLTSQQKQETIALLYIMYEKIAKKRLIIQLHKAHTRGYG